MEASDEFLPIEDDAPEQPEPEYTGTDLHPSQVYGYESKFDRLGTHRRVLGHVTDSVDIDALGPRNTVSALTHALATDANTPTISPSDDAVGTVVKFLEELEAAGLVECNDGVYSVTPAGATELAN